MNYYLGAWKKYAVFGGRARRKEYWMFYLINVIVSVACVLVAIMLFAAHTSLPIFLPFVYGLAVIVPTIALTVRRLHDTGRSGAWMLIVLVPLVGGIILLIFTLIDSKPGDNQYGPNPKGIGMINS